MSVAKAYYQPTQYHYSDTVVTNARECAKARIRKQRKRKQFRRKLLKSILCLFGIAVFVFPTSSVFISISDRSGGSHSAQESFIPDISQQNSITEVADQVLSEIIEDGMTKKQQVKAVYNWLSKNCSYGGHGDRSDYLQAAYAMLTERRGDCYSYFAASKLLFERLGIDNLDVRKVKNNPEDSDHYWNMVSLDDGETWYHFDATPRVGDGDDFCLVTDAFLDAYSKAHRNCHNRDKSLYPATPVN